MAAEAGSFLRTEGIEDAGSLLGCISRVAQQPGGNLCSGGEKCKFRKAALELFEAAREVCVAYFYLYEPGWSFAAKS